VVCFSGEKRSVTSADDEVVSADSQHGSVDMERTQSPSDIVQHETETETETGEPHEQTEGSDSVSDEDVPAVRESPEPTATSAADDETPTATVGLSPPPLSPPADLDQYNDDDVAADIDITDVAKYVSHSPRLCGDYWSIM